MLWARPQDCVTDVRGRAGVEGTVLAQDSAETDPGKDHGIFGRSYDQRDPCGRAGCLHTALNAESPLTGRAAMGQGALATRVLMGTASPGTGAFRAPEMRTADGLRVRHCVGLSEVTALTGSVGWRVTLSAIPRPTLASKI